MKTLAGYIASVREKMRDELTDTNIELDLEDGEIAGHILSAVDDVSQLIPYIHEDILTLYESANDDYFVESEDISAWTGGETATLVETKVSPARNITIKITDEDLGITSFTLTVVGKDRRGTAQTEVFYWAGGLEQESESLWSAITSVTMTAISGTGDTLSVGFGKRVHKGISLQPIGPTVRLDITTCRDDYGQEYFKDLLGFREVGYPATSTDLSLRNFTLFGGILRVGYNYELTAGDSILLGWAGRHILTFDSTSLPAYLEEVVLLGAVAHAFSSVGSRKIDMVNIGGAVPSQLRDISLIKRQEFDRKLRSLKPVRINKIYSVE